MPVNSFDNYPLTWKPDKDALTTPYYLSLSADLERQIRSGALAPGTRLPPQRELADYLDLNYTTITRVYDLCRKKGLVYGVMGRGTFVAPHAAEHVTITFPEGEEDCIEMGAIHAFSEYSGPVEQATRTVLGKGYLRQLYAYSWPRGYPHQLSAGVRWMEQMGVHTDMDHCAIFTGAQNALTVALLSLFSPGDRLAVDRYTYPNLIELARMFHLVLVPVAGDGEGMLPQALDAQCRRSRVRGVYLMPTCANPTGATMSPLRRQALAEVIGRHELILLEDDIAAWLFAGEGQSSLFDRVGARAVYICGMTKSLCPGLRVAFAAYTEDLRQSMEYGLFNINIKTSSLDAEIITELLLSGDAYRIVQHKRELTDRARGLYARYFPHQVPGPGYFQWLRLPRMPQDVERQLLRRGVRVYGAGRFTAADGLPREHLRVSLCSAGNMQRLESGLQRLRDALSELTQG